MGTVKDYFLPPKMSLPVLWGFDASLPLLLKQTQNIEQIIISDTDKRMLRSLKDERLVFFSNHPSQAEPLIAFSIANLMGRRFNYMATRRAFDYFFGFVGQLFQSIGAYSILPGVADRESMRMTRQILTAPGGKLAIFPEGEPMCSENDSLMPFQRGFIKLALSALEDIRKNEPNGNILFLPSFVKYVIISSQKEILVHLTRSIEEIEKVIHVHPGERNLLRRFLMVGRILLEREENIYGIEVNPDQDFDYRIGRVRHVILDTVASFIKAPHYNKEADAIQKLRYLTSLLELVELGYPGTGIPVLTPLQIEKANRECVKAYDLIVIKRDYLVSRPTPERFYEWLQRFQSLVLGGTPRALGGEKHPLPRHAHVFLGTPLRLGDFYPFYLENRNACVEQLLGRLRDEMQRLLDASVDLTYMIVEPGNTGLP